MLTATTIFENSDLPLALTGVRNRTCAHADRWSAEGTVKAQLASARARLVNGFVVARGKMEGLLTLQIA
jgi:hypothetical protein